RPFAREQDAEQCGDALVRERGAGAVSIAATSPRQPCSFASSSRLTRLAPILDGRAGRSRWPVS
ncbi:MAG: hypothetical protein ACRDRO_23040, partial [Pseudonocardiaceae bacterium]